MKKLLCLLMTAVLLLSMVAVTFHAAEVDRAIEGADVEVADDAAAVDAADEGADVDEASVAAAKVPNEVYVNQQESVTCTLAAATNMIRSRFYLSDNDSWKNITESSVHPYAWVNGMGLRGSFTYTYDGNSVSVGMTNVGGISVSTLKSLLNSHPEGVEIYSRNSTMHAVLVTDYEGDTFYCSDSDWGRTSDRIPLTSSLLGNYGSQANILSNIGAYWVVTSYSIQPTVRAVDLGDDFYGLILHKSSWKPIGNKAGDYPGTYKGNVELRPETKDTYNNIIWHFQRTKNNRYVITHFPLSSDGSKYRLTTGLFKPSNVQVSDLAITYDVGNNTSQYDTGNAFTKWYFMKSGSGYAIYEDSTNKVLDLEGGNTAYGTNVQIYDPNGTDAQIFDVWKLDPTRDKLNYSLSVSNDHTSSPKVTVNGAPYAVDYKFYIVDSNGKSFEYWKYNSSTFTVHSSTKEGIYTVYAVVRNPFGTETGSVTSKSVKVTVEYSDYEKEHIYDGIHYRFLDKDDPDAGIYICGFDEDVIDAVVPSTIEGYKVQELDLNRASGVLNIETLVLEDIKSIKSIEGYSCCPKLRSLKVLNGLETTSTDDYSRYAWFGGYGITSCNKLTEIELPNTLKTIGLDSFSGISASKIEIPESVETICEYCFNNCESLQSITIPENVKEIAGAFYGCTSLKTIVIKGANTTIGNNCFGRVYNKETSKTETLDGVTIYGVPGSPAETYANQYGITFKDINELPAPTEPTQPTEPVEPTQPVEPTEPIDPDAPRFEVINVKAMAGEEVSVELSVKNNPGITALSVQLSYPEELTLTSVDYTTPFSSKATGSNKLQSPFTVSWYSPSSADEDEDGVFATLTFKVAEDAALGTYPITLTYDEDNVFDSTFKNISFAVKNGTLTVHDHIAGDINGDTKVNMKDLVLLQQYINEWDVAVNESFADVNGDTKVNMKDLVLLQQHINGWEVELK